MTTNEKKKARLEGSRTGQKGKRRCSKRGYHEPEYRSMAVDVPWNLPEAFWFLEEIEREYSDLNGYDHVKA